MDKSNSLKIAISGKGGVGKSTLAAALALLLAERGQRVLALDADPDANLASALGVPNSRQAEIIPISKRLELIAERTGTEINEYGKVFKLNPDVSDVADKFGFKWKDIDLLVLGASQSGGGGCACPENTFIRALVTDLVLYKDDALIMDMEAGIEHLGRATAQGVDVMIVVLEPGKRSVDCAETVIRMAGEIGLKRLLFVGNKVTGKADEEFLRNSLKGHEFAAMIPYSETIRAADRDGVSVLDICDAGLRKTFEGIIENLKLKT